MDSISLSMPQLRTIARAIKELEPTEPGECAPGVRPGEVVTVTIHRSLVHGSDRVRVYLHRAHEHTITIGLMRDGTTIPSAKAA